MSSSRKSQEIQFYIDRSFHSLVVMTRSIVDNPFLSQNEQFEAMRRIAEHHTSLALMLQSSIHGGNVAVSIQDKPPQA